MSFDASERAFKIFTDAYGKAWSPRAAGLSVLVPNAAIDETQVGPLRLDTTDQSAISPEMTTVRPSSPL